MRVELTVSSQNEELLRLVREFAQGLGWSVGPGSSAAIDLHQPEEPNDPRQLLNLLTYVALSVVKTNGDLNEPLCRVRYREEHASEVTLSLRIAEIEMRK